MTKILSSKPFKKKTLAEQVANEIESQIVSGSLQGGEALPIEPEIAAQFGVSRAVVRDATRMLVAKGLVEAQHGKGVFVTHSQTAAFGDALLLALRRMNATNWDIAQFEQILYPEIVALAAEHATSADLEQIQQTADAYLTHHAQIAEDRFPDFGTAEYDHFQQLWSGLIQAIFAATDNQVITLLAQPLIQLHGPRDWIGLPTSLTAQETQFIQAIIDLIRSGDPQQARQEMGRLLILPPEAEAALRKTAVATPTTIRLA